MSSTRSIESWRAPRRGETTRFAKLTDTATQPVLPSAGRSTKSKRSNSATSKRANRVESLHLDHHRQRRRPAPTRRRARVARRRRARGSFGDERTAARIDDSGSGRARARAAGGGDRAENCRPECGGQGARLGASDREAQVDLNRVRSLRRQAIACMLSDLRSDPPFRPIQRIDLINRFLDRVERDTVTAVDIDTMNEVLHPKSLEGDAKLEKILIERCAELTRLDRYERRALSRRKTAIRNFDAYPAPEPSSPTSG